MHASAQAAFYDEMVLLEGATRHLYADTLGLPTCGIGRLIGSRKRLSEYGLALPWRTTDGDYATEAQVAAEWARLSTLGIQARGGRAYAEHATLWLDEPVVEWQFADTRDRFEATLAERFPYWGTWPADAQLAMMSMAWNLGAGFPAKWPALLTYLGRRSWHDAAYGCDIAGAHSRRRNTRNRLYFLNAGCADVTATPVDRLRGQTTLVHADRVAAAADNPLRADIHAWYVQSAMRRLGTYTAPLDARFGGRSQTGYTAACSLARVPAVYTRASVAAVMAAAASPVPVTD